MDIGQKILFLSQTLEGICNFSFVNHKMWSRKAGGALTSNRRGERAPAKLEGWRKGQWKMGW